MTLEHLTLDFGKDFGTVQASERVVRAAPRQIHYQSYLTARSWLDAQHVPHFVRYARHHNVVIVLPGGIEAPVVTAHATKPTDPICSFLVPHSPGRMHLVLVDPDSAQVEVVERIECQIVTRNVTLDIETQTSAVLWHAIPTDVLRVAR